MLVLGRKLGEKIVVPTAAGPVVITVTGIERNIVRLGVEAPREIQIYRRELLTEGQLAELREQGANL